MGEGKPSRLGSHAASLGGAHPGGPRSWAQPELFTATAWSGRRASRGVFASQCSPTLGFMPQ